MMIDDYRAQVRAALHNNDKDEALFLIRIIVGIRIAAGEIPVKLKKPKAVVA